MTGKKLTLVPATSSTGSKRTYQAHLYIQSDRVGDSEDFITFAIITQPRLLAAPDALALREFFPDEGTTANAPYEGIDIFEAPLMSIVSFPGGADVEKCQRALEHIGCRVVRVSGAERGLRDVLDVALVPGNNLA